MGMVYMLHQSLDNSKESTNVKFGTKNKTTQNIHQKIQYTTWVFFFFFQFSARGSVVTIPRGI